MLCKVTKDKPLHEQLRNLGNLISNMRRKLNAMVGNREVTRDIQRLFLKRCPKCV
jgi:hypothetical protein